MQRFNAWVYDPHRMTRTRGVSTAHLDVYPGLVHIHAKPFAARLGDTWDERYDHPAVVVQHTKPFLGATLLFEMRGRLASAAVRWRGRALIDCLTSAGFTVIEHSRWGFEAPSAVDPEIVGAHAADLPGCVLTRS